MSKESNGKAPSEYKILLGLTPKEVKKTTFGREVSVKLTKSKTEPQKKFKMLSKRSAASKIQKNMTSAKQAEIVQSPAQQAGYINNSNNVISNMNDEMKNESVSLEWNVERKFNDMLITCMMTKSDWKEAWLTD